MKRADFLAFGRPSFGEREADAVTRVLRSGWVGMGPETILFERELASAVKAPHVIALNSCTSAIFLALQTAGVTAGDEVICPSLTWCSTANAALYLRATPVFCDISADTLSMTVDSVLACVTARTRAVVAVHFGGLAIDVAALRRALPPHVRIIEDAAHAFGASYPDGSPVGSSGNPTCFSFYANKNLSTGDGGALAVFDDETADRVRSLRQHALPLDAWQRFTHPQSLLLSNELTELGYKMNFTDLQAALGRVQLDRQPEFARTRARVAQHYADTLSGFKSAIQLQAECTHPRHARHLFVVQLPVDEMSMTRDEVVVALRAMNIGASIHYAPLHTMPLYRREGSAPHLPTTERVARSIMTLPIGAAMTIDDAAYVTAELKSAVMAGVA